MKNISTFLLFLLAFGLTTYAQDLRFGVKGGLSINSFSLTNLSDGGTRLGIQLGLVSEISLENAGLSEYFALQPEVLFATKGAKYTANEIEIKERLSYVDVPILFKLKPLEAISLYAGPQVSFMTKGKYKYDAGDNTVYDNRDAFKAVDYGVAAGIGVQLATLFLDLRYNLGLRNVMGDRLINTVALEQHKARNRSFQLSVGYFFMER